MYYPIFGAGIILVGISIYSFLKKNSNNIDSTASLLEKVVLEATSIELVSACRKYHINLKVYLYQLKSFILDLEKNIYVDTYVTFHLDLLKNYRNTHIELKTNILDELNKHTISIDKNKLISNINSITQIIICELDEIIKELDNDMELFIENGQKIDVDKWKIKLNTYLSNIEYGK